MALKDISFKAPQSVSNAVGLSNSPVNNFGLSQLHHASVNNYNNNLEQKAFDVMNTMPDIAPVVDINTNSNDNIHIQDMLQNGQMYNPYTKISGTKATRNNNPGNITGMSGKLLYGASRIAHSKYGDSGDQRQLVYDTPEQGWKAMHSLMSGDRYNKTNIAQDFAKYQSDKKAWGNMLNDLRSKGINPDMNTFNKLSPAQKLYFMQSRARHEGFKGTPLTLQMLGY